MALFDIRNLDADLNIDDGYRDLIRTATDGLVEEDSYMYSRQHGGPCGKCKIKVYYQSPREDNYKDWVWLKVLDNKKYHFWIHINYDVKHGSWGWSVWQKWSFPESKLVQVRNMPPFLEPGPVYKTKYRRGEKREVFNEVCDIMLCRQ